MKKHRMNITYTDGNIKEVNIKTGNNENGAINTIPSQTPNMYAIPTPAYNSSFYDPSYNYKRKQYKNDRWIAFGFFLMITLFVIGSVLYLAETNPTLNIFNLSVFHFDLSKSYFINHPQNVNWLGYLILIWGGLTAVSSLAIPYVLNQRYNTYTKLGYILGLFSIIYVGFIYYIFIDASLVAHTSNLALAVASYNVHIPYLKSIKILLEVIAGYSIALIVASLLLSIFNIMKMHKEALQRNLIK